MTTITTDAQDQADMARLAAGKGAALNALMERHGERLLRYLVRVLQDESEAADLAQESFVRVYVNCARFKPGKKFSTWLYAIGTNLARDRLRRISRHPQTSLEAVIGSDTDLKEVLPAPDSNPLEQLERAERASAIQRALAELPEELRLPLVLSEYEQQSHAEIAAVLDCSSKAVEMRIYRARKQLRASLAPILADSIP